MYLEPLQLEAHGQFQELLQWTPENNNTHADCEVRLYPSGGGSISIHQECNLIAGVGKWKITGGTGIYEDLKGKGILTMPPNTEAMSGVIHWEK